MDINNQIDDLENPVDETKAQSLGETGHAIQDTPTQTEPVQEQDSFVATYQESEDVAREWRTNNIDYESMSDGGRNFVDKHGELMYLAYMNGMGDVSADEFYKRAYGQAPLNLGRKQAGRPEQIDGFEDLTVDEQARRLGIREDYIDYAMQNEDTKKELETDVQQKYMELYGENSGIDKDKVDARVLDDIRWWNAVDRAAIGANPTGNIEYVVSANLIQGLNSTIGYELGALSGGMKMAQDAAEFFGAEGAAKWLEDRRGEIQRNLKYSEAITTGQDIKVSDKEWVNFTINKGLQALPQLAYFMMLGSAGAGAYLETARAAGTAAGAAAQLAKAAQFSGRLVGSYTGSHVFSQLYGDMRDEGRSSAAALTSGIIGGMTSYMLNAPVMERVIGRVSPTLSKAISRVIAEQGKSPIWNWAKGLVVDTGLEVGQEAGEDVTERLAMWAGRAVDGQASWSDFKKDMLEGIDSMIESGLAVAPSTIALHMVGLPGVFAAKRSMKAFNSADASITEKVRNTELYKANTEETDSVVANTISGIMAAHHDGNNTVFVSIEDLEATGIDKATLCQSLNISEADYEACKENGADIPVDYGLAKVFELRQEDSGNKNAVGIFKPDANSITVKQMNEVKAQAAEIIENAEQYHKGLELAMTEMDRGKVDIRKVPERLQYLNASLKTAGFSKAQRTNILAVVRAQADIMAGHWGMDIDSYLESHEFEIEVDNILQQYEGDNVKAVEDMADEINRLKDIEEDIQPEPEIEEDNGIPPSPTLAALEAEKEAIALQAAEQEQAISEQLQADAENAISGLAEQPQPIESMPEVGQLNEQIGSAIQNVVKDMTDALAAVGRPAETAAAPAAQIAPARDPNSRVGYDEYVFYAPSVDSRGIRHDKLAVKYAVVELDELQPSHINISVDGAVTNPAWTEDELKVQRTYESGENAVRRADILGTNLNPDLVITSGNTVDGAPVIMQDGKVLGGNNRVMRIKIHYNKAQYRDHLQKYLLSPRNNTGIDAQAITNMKNPVLVRLAEVEPGEVINLIGVLNRTLTAKQDPGAEIANRGIRIGKNTHNVFKRLNKKKEGKGKDKTERFVTLNEFLSDAKNADDLVQALIADQVFTTEDMPTFWDDKNKKFVKRGSMEGKRIVEDALFGHIFPDAAVINSLKSGMDKQLRDVLPSLYLIKANKPEVLDELLAGMRLLDEWNTYKQQHAIEYKGLKGDKLKERLFEDFSTNAADSKGQQLAGMESDDRTQRPGWKTFTELKDLRKKSEVSDYFTEKLKSVLPKEARSLFMMQDAISRNAVSVLNDLSYHGSNIQMEQDEINTTPPVAPVKLKQLVAVDAMMKLDEANGNRFYKEALERAEEMEKQGYDHAEIQAETGYSRAADGYWRYEIMDGPVTRKLAELVSEMTTGFESMQRRIDNEQDLKKRSNMRRELKNSQKRRIARVKLGEIYNNETLYICYPELRDMPVNIYPKMDGVVGQFGDDEIDLVIGRPIEDQRETLIHEIQHFIQDQHYFAQGGNDDTIANNADRIVFQNVARRLSLKDRIEYNKAIGLFAKFQLAQYELQRRAFAENPKDIIATKWFTDKPDSENKKWFDRLAKAKGDEKKYNRVLSKLFDAWEDDIGTKAYEFAKFGTVGPNGRGIQLIQETYEMTDEQLRDMAEKANNDYEKAREAAKVGMEEHARYTEYIKSLTPDQRYSFLAGEVEARNAAARANLTAQQRLDTPVESTETDWSTGERLPSEYQVIVNLATNRLSKQLERVLPTLNQMQDERGQIQFTDDKAVISLFRKKSDVSTVLHEFNHFFINDFRSLIESGTASQSAIADWATLREFAGDGLMAEKGSAEYTESMETVARAWEKYLIDGNAPSIALIRPFQRIRAYMTRLYKDSMEYFDVTPTPEVKLVFDRMLATDEAIEQRGIYDNRGRAWESFIDETDDPEVTAMRNNIELAKGQARSRREAQDAGKVLKKLATDERRRIERRIFEKEPIYKVLDDALRNDGIVAEDLEAYIGKKALQDFDEKHFLTISKKPNTGITLQELFELNNKWDTIEDMVQELVSADSLNERVCNEVLDEIKQDADSEQENEAKTGDDGLPFTQEEDYEERAIESEVHLASTLAATEASKAARGKAATSKAAVARARGVWAIKKEAIKAKVQERFQKKTIREALDVRNWRARQADAARKAIAAAAKHNWAKVAELKEVELTMHYCIQESARIRDLHKQAQKEYNSVSLRKKLDKDDFKPKVENAYAEACRDLATFMGWNASARMHPMNESDMLQLPKMTSTDDLEDFVPGYENSVSNWLLYKKKPEKWGGTRDWTVAQTEEAVELMERLIADGRGEYEMWQEGRKAYIEDIARDCAAPILEQRQAKDKNGKPLFDAEGNPVMVDIRPDRPGIYDENKTVFHGLIPIGKAKNYINRWYLQGLLPETMMQMMDGNRDIRGLEDGINANMFYQARDCEIRKQMYMKNIMSELEQPLATIQADLQRITKERGEYFLIPNCPVPEKLKKARDINKWTADMVFSAALNMGNKFNIYALTQGYELDSNAMRAMQSVLSADSWKAIQKIWDSIGEMFSEVDAVTFRLTNRHVKRVESDSIVVNTSDGTTVSLKGGYYPLVYDPRLSDGWSENKMLEENKNIAKQMKFNTRGRATMEDGFITAREVDENGNPVVGKPPLLRSNILVEHINASLQYTTHAEFVKMYDRVLHNPVLRDAITRKFGSDFHASLRRWLIDLANPRRLMNDPMSQAANWARNRATVMCLGLRPTTGFKQRLGLFNAATLMADCSGGKTRGYGYIVKAMGQLGLSGIHGFTKTPEMVTIDSMSSYMSARDGQHDQAVRDAIEKTSPFHKEYTVPIINKTVTENDYHNFMFAFIQSNDRAAAYAVWLGAFNQAIDGNANIKASDSERAQMLEWFNNGANKDDAPKCAKKFIRYADKIAATQASSFAADLTEFQRGDGIMRFLTMFMSGNIRQGSRLAQYVDAMGLRQKSKGDLAKYMAKEFAAPALALLLVRTMLKAAFDSDFDDKEKNEILKDLVWENVEMTVAPFPLIKDIPSAIRYSNGGKVPAFDRLSKAVNSPGNLVKHAAKQEYDKALKDFFEGFGYAIGAPVGNIWQDVEYYKKAVNGE